MSPRPSSVLLSLNIRPISELYTDSRTHGYQGETRNVRLPRAASSGSGSIAKSEDGTRCVVAGKESLRILRVSESAEGATPEHKSSAGRGGHRIDASRNFWDGSGLKIDSASTDVAWGYAGFSNKIITSARNGELIMWDLNKAGPSKYERRAKDHIRSIHKLSYSTMVPHYCVTGSADGDLRVWDLRDMSKSLMRIHHPTSVRSVVFSPNLWQPLQVVVGLDNGSIYRWDLQMGQRGQLDRLLVAHSGPILALDWCNSPGTAGILSDGGPTNGMGWLASGGLDRTVKVWDLTAPNSHDHIPPKPTYTLHPSFPIRRILWRPSYDCELAVVSSAEFAIGSSSDLSLPLDGGLRMDVKEDFRLGRRLGSSGGDAVEIWDVRRGWIAKWALTGSAAEGGVADIAFGDPHAIWAQHWSGTFAQLDIRDSIKPLDAIPRVAATWEVSGSLAFVSDRKTRWEPPFDDIDPEKRPVARGRGHHLKTLGDKPFTPKLQNFGTYTGPYSDEDYETFSKLASGYIIEGEDRRKICYLNAERAYEAGKHECAQVWLLLGSLLPDFPLTPPPSPRPPTPLPQSVSAPAELSTSDMPGSYTFPPKAQPRPSPARSASAHTHEREHIPLPSSVRLTPTSSASSSPHRQPIGLPPLMTPRVPSTLGRRDSVDLGLRPVRRPSSTAATAYRSPSISTLSTTNTAASETSKITSLRHVGEGALDDSSSSGEGDGEGDAKSSGEEDGGFRPLTPPHLAKASMGVVNPSPLSRVAGWSEGVSSGRETDDDEEEDHEGDESSPSPQSTDSGSSGSSSPGKRGSRSRRQSLRATTKSRSRSSTVASLAAPHPLIRHDTVTSMATVTAGASPVRSGDGDSVRSFKNDNNGNLRTASANPSRRGSIDHLRDFRRGSVERMLPSHKRNRSLAISLEAGKIEAHEGGMTEKEETHEEPKPATKSNNGFSEKRKAAIRAEEDKLGGFGWDALRDALERFANEGDVQMCALVSVIAAKELGIGKKRVLHFVESYIDILDRMRLHRSSAYLRKHAEIHDVQATTGLETVIYTSCGRCRKAITQRPGMQRPKGGFGYCTTCRMQIIQCSICHLPVRTLLFQCSVCSHGGHQECYRRYYMERPMVDMGTALTASPLMDAQVRGRAVLPLSKEREVATAGSDVGSSPVMAGNEMGSPIQVAMNNRFLLGHACAAGCGHFCWVAGQSDDS